MGISALLAAQILDASATGRSVLTGADASAIRTTLGLGTLATQSPTGTPSASTFLRGDYSWQTIDLSGYVPYSGATGAVNLGANGLTASQATLSAGTLNGTVLDIAQTWGGTGTYTGIKYNVTDSGPANAASLLMDLQVGGTSKFRVRKGGEIVIAGGSVFRPIESGSGASKFAILQHHSNVLAMFEGQTDTGFAIGDTAKGAMNGAWVNLTGVFGWYGMDGSTPDVRLLRDAANTLAQRNSTNAQTFRVYNLFTDASNYERAKLAWESNVLRIGTEKAGTGSARALELQTDGTTRLTIASTGAVNASVLSLGTSGSQPGYPLTVNGNMIVRFGDGSATSRCFIGKLSDWLGGVNNESLTISSYQSEFHVFTAGQFASGEQALILRASEVVLGKNTTCNGNLTLSTKNLVTDTTTGTKIGTATTQKLGLWNATPIEQPTTAVGSATVASPGGGSTIKTDDTFDGYTIQQVVKALRNFGLLA